METLDFYVYLTAEESFFGTKMTEKYRNISNYQEESGLNFPGRMFDACIVRSGERKFQNIYPLLTQALHPRVVLRLDAERDESRAHPNCPGITAGLKVVDIRQNVGKYVAQCGIERTPGGLVIAFGHDMQISYEGEPVHKPEQGMTSRQIKTQIKDKLCTNQMINIKIATGLGAFGRNGNPQGCGLQACFLHQLSAYPFSSQEIDTYLTSISEDELKQVSGGILWENPILSSHIEAVDGVSLADTGFIQAKESLLRTLQGADPKTLPFLSLTARIMKDPCAPSGWYDVTSGVQTPDDASY